MRVNAELGLRRRSSSRAAIIQQSISNYLLTSVDDCGALPQRYDCNVNSNMYAELECNRVELRFHKKLVYVSNSSESEVSLHSLV